MPATNTTTARKNSISAAAEAMLQPLAGASRTEHRCQTCIKARAN